MYFDIDPPKDKRPLYIFVSLLILLLGWSIRAYFAIQEREQLILKTEMNMLKRIKDIWPEGKYLVCKYQGKEMPCHQCMLGGLDPVTEFESCSSALQNDMK